MRESLHILMTLIPIMVIDHIQCDEIDTLDMCLLISIQVCQLSCNKCSKGIDGTERSGQVFFIYLKCPNSGLDFSK